ncbi:MAG TPA: MBL fold metallo-hydrolase [Bryobacteraceae bacterium]|nr:MBL fold metallo-hydrolase [Bryobacteraceae bacterium]
MPLHRLWISLLAVAPAFSQPNRPVDEGRTEAGLVRLTVIHHASLMIEAFGQVIHVDPWSAGNYDGLPQADLILITHAHPDHLDPEMIAKLKKPGTLLLGPETIRRSLAGAAVIRNGETRAFGEWTIEAVPAYNLQRGPAPGSVYHPKGEGNGYVLASSAGRCYIAGDTEAVPEMKDLKDIMVAFLPMDSRYTMTPMEAAEAARTFRPRIVYPYHYSRADVTAFEKAMTGSGIVVRVRDWYY